jgi:hypothetical protein
MAEQGWRIWLLWLHRARPQTFPEINLDHTAGLGSLFQVEAKRKSRFGGTKESNN